MDALLEKEGFQARLLLQVHDELIFESPLQEMEALEHRVRQVMENAMKLDVPLQVDINTGKTWYEAK